MPRDAVSARRSLALLLLVGFSAPLGAQDAGDFPRAVFAQRRERLAHEVGGAPIIVPGAYLIRSGGSGKQDPSFWYLTGVQSPYAILVIVGEGAQRRDVLFLPHGYQFAGAQYPMPDERFRSAVWNRPIDRLAPGPDAVAATGATETYPIDEFARRLPELVGGATAVYLTRDDEQLYAPPEFPRPLSYRQQVARAIADRLPGVVTEDVTWLIDRMRLVKDAYEIAALRRAAAISVQGLVEAMRATRPGLRDLAIAGLMESVWKREGSPRTSFGPIVSSGPSSLTLYTLRSETYDFADRPMQEGDLLFVDYGAAEYAMYTSDVCRTWPVAGTFSPEQRRYYDIVLEAQDSALATIRPGIMMRDVIRAAAMVFGRHGLQQYEDIDRMGPDRVWGIMPSPTYWVDQGGQLTSYSGARGTGVRDLGHHIGLEALDSRDYTRPLAPGMVFTVEPKLYIPEKHIAIMIEDMILVTDRGYENLTAAAPRHAADIERVMAGGR